MKRANCLFERITEYSNVSLAFLKAIRGKRSTPEALRFCRDTAANLEKVRRRLRSVTEEEQLRQRRNCIGVLGNAQKPTGALSWGPYHQFTITDPKERIISAVPIEDRIIHHAIMNILEPLFERQMIFHTYACRPGKGMHRAVLYAFTQCKARPFYLKLDIRAYFNSVDHAVLKEQLRRIIKDRTVIALLDSIIDSYHTAPGKGLPIGNLTSQFFANLYLSKLDHYILERLRPRAYARYMDDFVLWAGSKAEVRTMLAEIAAFSAARLRLTLKPPVLGSCADGLPFLGFKIKRSGIYLLQKSKRRMARRLAEIRRDYTEAKISEEHAADRVVSVYAAVLLARTGGFRRKLWKGNRFGHEPDDPGRELEQQCV